MNVRLMIWIALVIAAMATVLAWSDPNYGFRQSLAMLAFAFIVSLAALIEAVGRCASALESTGKTSSTRF